MFATVKRLFTASIFRDDDRTITIRLLNAILLTGVMITLVLVISALTVSFNSISNLFLTGVLLLLELGGLLLLRRRQQQQLFFAAQQRHAQELALLERVRAALARELDLATLFHLVVEAIAETFGYTLVSLYRLEGEVLLLQHQVGYEQMIPHIPITEGVCGRVVRTGQPVLIEDVRADPDFLGAFAGIVSEVCIPLFDNGHAVGVLNVESTGGVTFSTADLQLMTALSEHVSIAISRARLHTEVRQKEQQFRLLFENAPTGMIVARLDGQVVRVNQAYCHVVGFTPEELLKLKFVDYTHPEDLERNLALVNQLLRGEIDDFQMEKRYIHKDGHIVHVLIRVGLIHDAADRPFQMVAQVVDISEHKRAEEALKARAHYMALLNDITHTSLQAIDFQTMLQSLADRLGDLIGADGCFITLWDETEQRTIPAAAYNVPDYGRDPALRPQPGEITMTKSVLAAEKPLIAEDVSNSPYISPNIASRFPTRSLLGLPLMAGGKKMGAALIAFSESHHFTEDEISRCQQAAGQIALAVAQAQLREQLHAYTAELEQEVAERLEAEEQLRQQTAQLEALRQIGLELSAELQLDVLLQSIMSQAVKLLDGKLGALYLFRPERQVLEVVATVNTHVPLGTVLQVSEGIAGKVVQTGQPLLVKEYQTWEGRSPTWTDTVADSGSVGVPILSGSEVLGVIALASKPKHGFSTNDLELLNLLAAHAAVAIQNAHWHERIQRYADELEERVAERTSELAQANEQLQELDQLKTKFIGDVSHEMRTPITSLNLYLDLLERGKPESRSKYMAVLKEHSDRLAYLVDDIMNISRLNLYEGETEFKLIDLNETIASVVTLHQHRAEELGLTLEFQPSTKPLKIMGQRNQIIQAITNLINNAINYTPSGTIRVVTRQHKEENGASIHISDTGVGIKPEDFPYIFDRFYRGQQVGQLNIPGTGLGLAIVKEIVTLHQGIIEVDSTPDKGSTFKIGIPLATQPNKASNGVSMTRPPLPMPDDVLQNK